ncbi:hypothetical protein [Capnocytophaga stomatis]|uniref:hypothetical protein n=1 Tax=Capnocytophaga stomatis TaxID=1848904 RepID=UPI001AC18C18|nr:hypothetical protein [Capnocytophaga stomatis]GIM50145.1 hypothetical protein CAPN003_15970 [Capnocytophaga stomatis]
MKNRNIEFYNLDIEYPVNWKFWEEVPALFLLLIYNIFYWEKSFEKETYARIKKSFIDFNLKKSISFQEYEEAKDRLASNYSCFKYYYERAEKITSYDFKKKIDWTIKEVYKNLQPRISAKNRLNIQYDFYKNCYTILYDKLIINSYSIKNKKAEHPKLLNNISPYEEENVYNIEIPLTFSEELKKMFKDIELYDKIDFYKLKDYGVLYNEELSFKKRVKTDIILLILVLRDKKIIQLKNNKDIVNVVDEILNEKVTESHISKIMGNYSKDNLSANNLATIKAIKEFIKINLEIK